MLPPILVMSVLLGQCHRIGHMSDPCIVCRQYELHLFIGIRNLAENLFQVRNVFGSRLHTLFRILLLSGRYS